MRRLVVIGASAGGFDAIGRLFEQLPSRFRAAVFVVLHSAPSFDAASWVSRLRKRCPLDCKLASDGERFHSGVIYIARPDAHLLVKGSSDRGSPGDARPSGARAPRTGSLDFPRPRAPAAWA